MAFLKTLEQNEHKQPNPGIWTWVAITTVTLYYSSCEWLDTRDASSWNRNTADFTSVGYLTQTIVILSSSEGIFTYIFFYIYVLDYRNAQFTSGSVSWSCRIHRLHLSREVKLPQRVFWIWHKTIWCWGSSNAGALCNAATGVPRLWSRPYFSNSVPHV